MEVYFSPSLSSVGQDVSLLLCDQISKGKVFSSIVKSPIQTSGGENNMNVI